MKKYIFYFLIAFVFSLPATGQVICIRCYDQNDSIGSGVINLLQNGGFENGTCTNASSSYFCPNSSLYSCNIANWICTGGGTSTYAALLDTTTNSSIIIEGSRAAYFGNYYCNACSPALNDTSCINRTQCVISGVPPGYPNNTLPYGGATGVSLQQTTLGLTPGNTYVLEFWTGGEDPGYFPHRGIFALDLGFGDTLLACKPTKLNAGSIGSRYLVEFIATSAVQTVKFTNWGHVCGTCTELILDDVKLYTLAELERTIPDCITGVNEQDENIGIRVYPNPVTNEITAHVSGNEQSEIIIYDITGRKLFTQEFINSISYNLSGLPSGIYMYLLRNKHGWLKYGKIIKE